jgi:hypothetical protein
MTMLMLSYNIQVSLQTPQSHQMDLIVSFYNNVSFYLMVAIIYISWLLFVLLNSTFSKKIKFSFYFTYLLNILATLLILLTLCVIVLFAFRVLCQTGYIMCPEISVRVIGPDWISDNNNLCNLNLNIVDFQALVRDYDWHYPDSNIGILFSKDSYGVDYISHGRPGSMYWWTWVKDPNGLWVVPNHIIG